MFRLFRAGSILALLAFLVAPASLAAQAGTTAGATAATQYPAQGTEDDDGFNPGWLGLLGLLGLAGLRRRREEPVVRRDVDATTTRRA